ncbi:MAG: hypothetical protein J5J00_12575 [Deltaproteobacteria bacterium]|nr:hypothetical protein [Deltaproteobacteria bacterium]
MSKHSTVRGYAATNHAVKGAIWSAALCVTILVNDVARADGPAAASEREGSQESAASFDGRLPPVLPGEVVADGDRKMKVWSTSGPVPVNDPPAAPGAPHPGIAPGTAGIGEVGVIIDRDSGKKRR